MTATTKKTTRKKAGAKTEEATELTVVSPTGNALQKQAGDVMSMIERVALNPDLPIERLERLFAFQKEVMAAQAKMEYDAAMARFQQLKEPVAHNRVGEGPGGSEYTYSDYPQMTKTIAPWLRETQLSYSHRQDPPVTSEQGKIMMIAVHTLVSHVGGHTEEVIYPAIPDYKLEGKQALNQIVQRALTYAKRQGLAEILGLATAEDRDDLDAQKPTLLVSDEQAANIKALIEEVKANPVRFYDWCSQTFKAKVHEASDIPANCYAQAVRALEAKRK